jgi:FtsZ-binding cell division protein ZapB
MRVRIPPSASVEPLLTFAEELERRDADLGVALDAVDTLQREIEELRAHAATAAAFLSSFPGALDALERDEGAAQDARAAAERTLREAEAREDERVTLQAGDALRSAERWVAEAALARRRLEEHRAARRADADRLEARADALAGSVHDVPAPAGGLDGVLEWASRARGSLLLEQSALVRERDAVVREANELLGSVLGEPLTSTAAAGVRAKLERALQGGAP